MAIPCVAPLISTTMAHLARTVAAVCLAHLVCVTSRGPVSASLVLGGVSVMSVSQDTLIYLLLDVRRVIATWLGAVILVNVIC